MIGHLSMEISRWTHSSLANELKISCLYCFCFGRMDRTVYKPITVLQVNFSFINKLLNVLLHISSIKINFLSHILNLHNQMLIILINECQNILQMEKIAIPWPNLEKTNNNKEKKKIEIKQKKVSIIPPFLLNIFL